MVHATPCNQESSTFSKIFCHFSNVRMKTNAFPEEVIADHEEEEYKNNLQGPLESLSQI